VQQRTAEWYQARSGRVTGSRAADVVARLKSGGEAAARRDYRTQLTIERITGLPLDTGNGYVSTDMRIGIEREAEALRQYEARCGVLVTPCAFVAQGTELGVSPDGLVGSDGIVETKAPKPATQLSYLKAATNSREGFQLPPDYGPQVAHSLHVTGRAWCDFVSYCPEWPYPLDLFVVRVENGTPAVAHYVAQLEAFLVELQSEVATVTALLDALAMKTVTRWEGLPALDIWTASLRGGLPNEPVSEPDRR
jgi:YqaJ-like viral recombinase domain